jgi:hypothetical protein
MTIDAMGSLLYEPDCSMWAGNPTCRQIDFDPNQCDVWFRENGRAARVQTIRWNDVTSISLERVVTIDHCHLQSADSVYANHIE